jgi:hypothetical protein
VNGITLNLPAVVAVPDPGQGEPSGLYHSLRHVCTLAAGMMQGAGEQYGEPVADVRTTCLDDGEDRCTFQCTFLRAVEGG